jgi:hypothetical protein
MRRRSLVRRSLVVAALWPWVATCSDPTTRNLSPSPLAVSSAEIIGPATVAPGAAAQFNVTVHLSDGTTKDATTAAAWDTSNHILMYMSPGGVAHGFVGTGDVTLSADVPHGPRVSREVVVVPDGTFRLVGKVTDGEFPSAGVAGAQVQALGPGATTTDALGNYKLYGMRADSEVHVTREGYQPLVQTVHLTGHATQNFQLMPIGGTRLNVAGSYTLTIDAAPGCSGPDSLPDSLQHRSYQATVTQNAVNLRVDLTEPRFKPNNGLGNYFTGAAEVGGATFTLTDYVDYYYYHFRQYPNVAEQLSDGTVLVVAGQVVTKGTAAGLSGQFVGSLTHYDSRFPSPSDRYLGGCFSTAHQFTLTPR